MDSELVLSSVQQCQGIGCTDLTSDKTGWNVVAFQNVSNQKYSIYHCNVDLLITEKVKSNEIFCQAEVSVPVDGF